MSFTAGTATPSVRNPLLLVIAYLGFISLGLPDTVIGVAWPALRDTFSLSQSDLGIISLALGSGYFVSSFLSGQVTRHWGIGSLLAVSTLFVALAMFGTALAPWWFLIPACGMVWGLGSGAIDAGLNGFVAAHFSARHVNWLHACYSIGATLGPLVMTASVVKGGSWRLGYLLVGGLVLALAVCFMLTRRRWDDHEAERLAERRAPIAMSTALSHPLVWIQVILFFFYTGLELMVGHWCFTLLTESRGVPAEIAGVIASGYFGAILCGRVLLGAVADRLGVDQLVRMSLGAAVIGSMLFAVGSSLPMSIVGLALLGLGLAPVFPCLMARTPRRLGAEYAAHAVGFQVSAATTGAAVVPALAGVLAERVGLEPIAMLSVLLAAAIVVLHELLLSRSASA